MKNCILGLIIGFLALSCNQKSDGFTINGEIRGDIEEGTQVFLKKIGDNNQPVEVDTATTIAGAFTFTGVADSMELHYIFVDKIKAYTAIILENGDIEFNAQRDSLGYAKVKGTLQNDIFSDYMKESRALSAQAQSIQRDMQSANQESILALQDELKELTDEYKEFELAFVKSHPEALISALVLDRAISTKAAELEELESIFNSMTPEIKSSKPGKKIEKAIERLKKSAEAAKSTAVGAKAPNFSGPNPEGKEIALNDVMGKVTLIDFWAAWCKPCRKENPNVVNVYNKYHDKGLNIVGVSLDKTKEAWIKAIEDDGLTWNHISNISYFNDEIAQLYNVRAIPAAFLIDENGVIVGKNLRGPALEAKVAELLN